LASKLLSLFAKIPMHERLDHHSVVVVGTKPGAAVVMHRGMLAHPTLVGYIEATAREVLAIAELEMHEHGELHQVMIDLLHEVRDAYNEALGTGDDDEASQDSDGNAEVFARFKVVLREFPQAVPTRRFPRRDARSMKTGETSTGAIVSFLTGR